jgi:hypothetical protein
MKNDLGLQFKQEYIICYITENYSQNKNDQVETFSMIIRQLTSF